MSTPTVIVLVGPKGAGKSYLGRRMRDELGYGFVDVERLWLELRAEPELPKDQFDLEGQGRIVHAIATSLETSPFVVVESTGAATWFGSFVERLKALAAVEFIKVMTPLNECLARIERRDSSVHIPTPVERINQVNAISEKIELPWAHVLENRTPADADAFLERLREQRGDHRP